MTDFTDLKKFFLQGVGAKIAALESVKEGLKSPGSETYNSIRRIAQTLLVSGKNYGFPQVEKAAGDIIEASNHEIGDCLERLLAILRSLVSVRSEEKFTILIVEDTPDIAQLVALTLKAPNREILIAETCAFAKQILDERDISLIITDLVLPDMDGRNLLMELRERPKTAAIPIFVLTSQGGSQPETECYALGADEFFRKPFDPRTLASAVSAKLQRTADRVRESRIDLLTGLPNRAAFNETLTKELAHSMRTGHSFSLALADIDRHEAIKSKYGNEIGNSIIQHTAQILKSTLRETDLIARWEGSIFAVFLHNTPADDAARILQSTLEKLRDQPFRLGNGETIYLTFSVGINHIQKAMPANEAIESANCYLYYAKTMGRNRVLSSADSIESIHKKIILVEDDELTATVIIHRLKREQLDVIHFMDGASAFEALQNESISLGIFDVNVPVMDGFELIQRARNIPTYTDLPIIMLTGMGSEKDIERGFSLGANDYILKPFSPVELLARIHRLLKNTPTLGTASP